MLTGNWQAGLIIREAKTGIKRYAVCPSAEIGDIHVSADGTRFVLGETNGAIRVFDVATGSQLGRGMQHANGIQAVALNSDGSHLVTGSTEGTIRLWEVATSQPLGPPMAHSSTVWDVHFAEDGQTFSSIDWRGIVKHWPVPHLARGEVPDSKAQLEKWTLTTLDSGAPTLLNHQEWLARSTVIENKSANLWFADQPDKWSWHESRATDAEGDFELIYGTLAPQSVD